MNRYTNQVLQHEDIDKDELSNRLKQLNIIDDGLNPDKLNAYLSSKARDKSGDEIIIEYAFAGNEDDDKYGLKSRLPKELRDFSHKHKMRRSAKFIVEKNLISNR